MLLIFISLALKIFKKNESFIVGDVLLLMIIFSTKKDEPHSE